MSYDSWKTTEPDRFDEDERPEEPPCKDCGAPPDEPCEWYCDCVQCNNARLRQKPEVA